MYLTGEQTRAIAEFADGAEVRVVEIREPASPGVKRNQFSVLNVTRIEDKLRVRVDEYGKVSPYQAPKGTS